jgi:Tfp pilus assembly protein PilO
VRGLLLFLLGAAFPLAVYRVSFHPDRAQTLKAAEARLSAREKELQSLTAVADRLPDFEREQQELKDRLTALERVRPPSSDTAALVDELRGLAASEGVARVSIEELAAGAGSETLPLRLQGEGSQRQLAALLGRLGGTARLLRLERVELERQDNGRYALALRLCAFREKPAS